MKTGILSSIHAAYTTGVCYHAYILCNMKTDILSFTGGWSLIGVRETGTWNVNGEQFIKEKLLGSSAFYDFGVEPDSKDSTKQLLQVT